MPNNAGGNENCVVADGNHDSRWDDYQCTRLQRFICQKFSSPSQNPPATTTSLPCSQKCGVGWEQDPNTDNCYQFQIDVLSWADARAACQSAGGDLASITSVQEQFYLSGRSTAFDSDFFWIGANDIASERGWRWANKAPFAFLNWDVKQPDNAGNADCVAMVKKNGRWDDFPCQSRNGYICQKRGFTTFTPLPSTTPPVHIPPGKTWGCPRGWDNFRGSCYLAVPSSTGINWRTANAVCSSPSMRGALVAITDEAENKYVTSLLPRGYNDYVWIGLSDLVQENTYIWVDGTPVTYPHWVNGEPSHRQNEDCVTIRTNSYWYDTDCSHPYKLFVCKKNKSFQSRIGSQEEQGCADGTLGYGAQCYTFVHDLKTFNQAEGDCRTRAGRGNIGHLATVDNSQLQGFLASELDTQAGPTYWVGMYQCGYDYYWQSNSHAKFTYFGTNHTGLERSTCVAMQKRRPTGLWQNHNCNDKMPYICESPRKGFSTPTTRTTVTRPQPCPRYWTAYGHLCYKAFMMNTTDILSWTEARSFCSSQADHGALVTLSDKDLETWLVDHLLGGVNASGNFWIGLNDRDTEQDVQCGNSSWIEYGGFCYFISPDDGDMSAVSWFDARDICGTLYADLVSVGGEDENGFLTSLISKTNSPSFWIGLNDLDQDTYSWTDISPVTYVRWGVNEPNDNFGGERCVEMTTAGVWNVFHCQAKRGYVCKKRPGDFKPTMAQTTPPTGGCPLGFSTLPQLTYCYYVGGKSETTRQTYDDAVAACGQVVHGAQLASVHSTLDARLIMTLLTGLRWPAWIGLNDRRVRNQFEWVDNTKVDFSNWAPHQPDENLKDERPDMRKDCVDVETRGINAGLWNDKSCSGRYAYVCSIKKSPAKPSRAPDTTGCRTGYQRFQSSGFKYSAEAVNWTSAGGFCKADGGHLVSIGDSLCFHWKETSSYQWADGWPVKFTNWGQGEPSQQSCVSHVVDGEWQNLPCEMQLPFVCEINLDTPPPPTGSLHGVCPDAKWYNFGGFCYLVETHNLKSWPGASYACQILGASLVSIHSDSEAHFLTTTIGRQRTDVWIGLQKGQTFGFSWSDSSEVEYLYWGRGEPSDPDRKLHQDCVKVNNNDGTWADTDCFDTHGYVCKVLEKGATTTTTVNQTSLGPAARADKHQAGNTNDNNDSSGLGAGPVAGIAVGAVVFLVLVVVVSVLLTRFLQRQPPGRQRLGGHAVGFDNASFADKEKVQFSET